MRLWMILAVACAGTPTAELTTCGGLAGVACDDGFTCLDDPSDDCDPSTGGADCGGLCFACDDPSLHREYVSTPWPQCEKLDFGCDVPREVPFDDACGCGCARP